MKGALRVTMSWLHGWTGLVCGWLILAIAVTGTASVFRQEIEAWARPVLAAHPDTDAGLQRALDRQRAQHPQATTISLAAAHGRTRDMASYWQDDAGHFGQAWLDPATGDPVAGRDTRASELFYRFHFELMMAFPWGRLLACVAGLAFTSAVISGVITHKRIFADIFTFRPQKGGQRAWLDGHNLLGVLALPFQALIMLTGVITLASTFLPFGVMAGYGGDTAAFFAEQAPETAGLPKLSGQSAPFAPLAPMLAQARTQMGGEPARILAHNPGDATARITIYRDNAERLARPAQAMVFDGVTGRVVSAPPPGGPGRTTYDVLYGLHMGEFAGPVLRGLYFLAGLSAVGLTATGLVLWTVSRRRRLPDPARPDFGFRLVEVMNVAAVMGSPLAVVATLWAMRLLPDTPGRPEWENRTFLLTLAAALVYAALRRPQRRTWTELGALTGALFALTPLMSALSGGRSLPRSLAEGDWAMVGFDAVMLALGAGFGLIVLRARRA